MENFQSKNIQTENLKQSSDDQKLAEALLLQEYAAEKQGLKFSEQANDESYDEAESLLNELEEKGIKLEGMDLSKVNLRELSEQDELGEKLEQKVAHLAVDKEDPGIIQKIGEVMGAKGIRKIVMLLSLFSVLSAEETEAASKKGIEHHAKQEHKKSMEPEKFAFDGVRATFEFNANGKLDRCTFRLTRQHTEEEKRKLDIASNKMIVDDYMQIAEDKILKRGGTMIGIQAKLKDVRRNYMVAANLYHELLQRNKKEEAALLKEKMQEGLDRVESSFGAKIFDRVEAERIFNAGK